MTPNGGLHGDTEYLKEDLSKAKALLQEHRERIWAYVMADPILRERVQGGMQGWKSAARALVEKVEAWSEAENADFTAVGRQQAEMAQANLLAAKRALEAHAQRVRRTL